MVRPVVIAEEKLLTYLNTLTVNEGFIPGLILGQCTNTEKDYVIHLARTPLPISEKHIQDVENSKPSGDNLIHSTTNLNHITDIEESWLITHAKTVTRMLPGGMWVLGLFIVGPKDIFSENISLNKISSLISHVGNCTKSNIYLNGQNPKKIQLVLHFNSISKTYICKVFDAESLNMSVRPIDWKFQPIPSTWYRIECRYNMEKIAPVYITNDKAKYPLKRKLRELLISVNNNVQKAVCTLGGRVRNNEDLLENIKEEKQNEEIKEDEALTDSIKHDYESFEATLFVLQDARERGEKINVQFIKSICDFECRGFLSSQVFLHQKATVEEAIKAIKEDIIRSWAARLEMHWDTYEDKSIKEAREFHTPPRRVTYPLPYVPVNISEYLFPDEEPTEALLSIEEQLGFEGDLDSLNSNLESLYDPKIHQPLNQDSSEQSISNAPRSSRVMPFNIMIISIISAAFVLLLAMIIQIFFRDLSS